MNEFLLLNASIPICDLISAHKCFVSHSEDGAAEIFSPTSNVETWNCTRARRAVPLLGFLFRALYKRSYSGPGQVNFIFLLHQLKTRSKSLNVPQPETQTFRPFGLMQMNLNNFYTITKIEPAGEVKHPISFFECPGFKTL